MNNIDNDNNNTNGKKNKNKCDHKNINITNHDKYNSHETIRIIIKMK